MSLPYVTSHHDLPSDLSKKGNKSNSAYPVPRKNEKGSIKKYHDILESKRPPAPPKHIPSNSLIRNDLTSSKKKTEPLQPPPITAIKDISDLRQSRDCPPQFRPKQAKKECSHVTSRVDKTIAIANIEDASSTFPSCAAEESKPDEELLEEQKQSEPQICQTTVNGRRPPPGPPPSFLEKFKQNNEESKKNQRNCTRTMTKNKNMKSDNDEEISVQEINTTPLRKFLPPKMSNDKKQLSQPINSGNGESSPLLSNEKKSNVNNITMKKPSIDNIDIRPGSLWIRCIEASNIRRKDQTMSSTSLNVFICFSLGSGNKDSNETEQTPKSCIQRNTKVQYESGHDPNFQDEIVKLDVMDANKVTNLDGSIYLKIQLFDHFNWENRLLGEVTISVQRFFTSNGKKWDEWIPLKQPDDSTSNSKIHLEFEFHESHVGVLVLTLFECNKLVKENDIVENPYVSAEIGDKVHERSRVIENGGINPYFGEEKILLWVDESNWFQPMKLKVWEASKNESDNCLIGESEISINPYMNKSIKSLAREEIISLSSSSANSDDENTSRQIIPIPGLLRIKIDFLQAGDLNVQVIRGKCLRAIGNPYHMDPFVVLKIEGNCSSITKRTTTAKDGGVNPTWDEVITLHIVDQYILLLECYDHDPLTDETSLVGYTEISLLPVFKIGHIKTCVQLIFTNEFGVDVDSGQIDIVLDFIGPQGVAYPQYQPSIASFDETHRINPDMQNKSDANEEHHLLAQDVIQKSKEATGELFDCGFTNDEIKSSFQILDLDKNGYLGAAEIRHVLICMGELVTDDEIDMMINMLDTNGDGQVSLDEFSSMVHDPNPGREEFDISKKRETTSTSPSNVMVSNASKRNKEIHKRNRKRILLSQYVEKYKLTIDDILLLWRMFEEEHTKVVQTAQQVKKRIDFNFYCKCLPVERTGETKVVFELFDKDGSGLVSIIEVILGLVNFLPLLTVKKKCKIVFDIVDGDRSGYLSLSELEEVLVGNHMMSQSMIVKKAQTIMRVANTDNSGRLSLQELIIVASKFPNLIFPDHIKALQSPFSE